MKFHKHQRGFSLLELVLVLALLIVIATLAAPALTNSLKYRTLKESADLVRGEFSKTRARAMQSGQEYVFSYFPETGQYAILPFEFGSQASFEGEPGETTGNYDYGKGFLARGVVFVATEIAQDIRELELQEDAENPIGGMNGPQQILFYPDGTTQSATIYLRSDSRETIGIELRGLTGVSSICDSTGADK